MIFWLGVFAISLVVMIKGADWFLKSAEKIGLAAGLSPFIVGVTIVGLGTSFPEMISSLVAVFDGFTEIVPANAIGSNIANILLVVGASVLIGKRLTMTKSLIDIDLPLLAITTLLAMGVVWDGVVSRAEGVILLLTFVIYILYTAFHRDDEAEIEIDILPSRVERRKHKTHPLRKKGTDVERPKLVPFDFLLFIGGLAGLLIGAKYLIDSVVALSEIVGIGVGIISLAAVSLGTSMPELAVSLRAALKRKSEVALGNIFGSNVFNLLAVMGIPALIKPLTVDSQTLALGVPALLAATLLFTISGISNRIYMWEGAAYVLFYFFFIGKLFGLL